MSKKKIRRFPRTKCCLCGRLIRDDRMEGHLGDGECRARALTNKLREKGLIAPSEANASTTTVKMLARHAGVELRKEPIRNYDYGSKWCEKKRPSGEDVPERYVPFCIYVAPAWLCELAAVWRKPRYRRNPSGTRSRIINPFPPSVLERLRRAADEPRLRGALLAQLTLLEKKP